MKHTSAIKKPVDIVVPMLNAESTIISTLKSIEKQAYPVGTVFVVDNISSDNSVKVVRIFKKKTKLKISLVIQKSNDGVGASFNKGISRAKSAIIVLMHSDSALQTNTELAKLIQPFKDPKVVLSYPTLILPRNIWKVFNFWQQCLLVQSVDNESSVFTGKFDALKKSAFIAAGGFNTTQFGQMVEVGGEDADLYLRMQREGRCVKSTAYAVHLHNLNDDYSIVDWIRNRKLLARSYGTIVRLHWNKLPTKPVFTKVLPLGSLIFFIKPLMAVLPFIPGFFGVGIILLVGYSMSYSQKMYTSQVTLSNPRILLLPFIDIFLIYYESYWIIRSLITTQKDV